MSAYLTPDEAAEYVGVSRRTIYRWLHSGTLPAKKFGASWRIALESLESMTTDGRTAPEPRPLIELIAEAESIYMAGGSPVVAGAAARSRSASVYAELNRRVDLVAREFMQELQARLDSGNARGLAAFARRFRSLPAPVRRWAFAWSSVDARDSFFRGDLEPVEFLDAAVRARNNARRRAR